MRNNNCKNQNTQLPAQVAAETANMNVLPAICAVKATLHHIDGHVSEILMTLPRYTGWTEFLEDGQNSIREYVYQLTRHWIKISHFFIKTGTITTNGTLASCFLPGRFDIPLGKFYNRWNRVLGYRPISTRIIQDITKKDRAKVYQY